MYDTEENGRSEYTEKTLESLLFSVDFRKHRLVIIDNNSCQRTKDFLSEYVSDVQLLKEDSNSPQVITLDENIGTARAINLGMKMRLPGENVIKMDNDCVVNKLGWVDEMEEAISRDNTIGIIGLKRKDIDFDPNHENENYRSELIGLPHKAGERWINVERGVYIMGTCTMYNSALIDKIGGLGQPGVYGFDDSTYSLRSHLAGFWNCYIPHIDIDHIDDGSNPYTLVKQQQASEKWDEYHKLHAGYISGEIPLYIEI